MKVCVTCGTERPLDLFEINRNREGHPYRRNVCKVCRAAQKRRKPGVPRNRKPRYRAEKPLPLTYRRGERCWCCRREATQGMLCRKCAG